MPTIARWSHPQKAERAGHLRLLHTSDLHIGWDHGLEGVGHIDVAAQALLRVIEVASGARADAILIAGDFFDNNRLPDSIVAAAATVLGGARLPILILPGNHDPMTPDSIYLRYRNYFPDNVRIIGSAEGELVRLEPLGLQIWGQAHTSYYDFRPCSSIPRWDGDGRSEDWRIAIAHGHFVRTPYDERYCYQIHAEELRRLHADYVALGHWDICESVGATVPAYYSGSPCRIGSLNLVDLDADEVSVRQFQPS